MRRRNQNRSGLSTPSASQRCFWVPHAKSPAEGATFRGAFLTSVPGSEGTADPAREGPFFGPPFFLLAICRTTRAAISRMPTPSSTNGQMLTFSPVAGSAAARNRPNSIDFSSHVHLLIISAICAPPVRMCRSGAFPFQYTASRSSFQPFLLSDGLIKSAAIKNNDPSPSFRCFPYG